MRTLILLLLSMGLWASAHGAELEGSNISGYDFNYGQVEKGCTAHRESGSTISIRCKDKSLKAVARSCEGIMYGGLDSVKLNCGGGLWSLNNRCKIEMRGADFGELNCRL